MWTITMIKNLVFHSRSKHIEIHHHLIRELVEEGHVELKFCKSEDQLANTLTKASATEKFIKFREIMEVEDFQIKGEC